MRQKIIFIIVLLLIMAVLPFTVSNNIRQRSPQPTFFVKSQQTEKTDNKTKEFTEETLCSLVAARYQDEYNKETLKAIAVILHTNYKIEPESFDFNDKDIFISESEADNSLKENYHIIKTAVNEVYDKTLCQNDKAFYIPYYYLSDGTTDTSEEFPYIQSVASPWDCYSNEYNEDNDCVGISLYGLNYLCENGYDYSTALEWYLPDFEIQ